MLGEHGRGIRDRVICPIVSFDKDCVFPRCRNQIADWKFDIEFPFFIESLQVTSGSKSSSITVSFKPSVSLTNADNVQLKISIGGTYYYVEFE